MQDAPEEFNDPIIGKIIDNCRVDRKIGQGGMGVVYAAIHESLDQEFCLKILNPALVGAEDTVDRFFREAQACAQLNHPNIVAIQNVGQEGEYYFIRMEYIEGKTLEQMVKDAQKLPWTKAVSLCLETAEALAHAHQKGMIHRDIKPENVMQTPKGEVKVMDFGLAKHVHSSAKVSVTGQIVGTPFFMSPEQAGGKPTDARSDIYSLGVTLYYLVTGVKPFNGKNLQEIFLKHFFYSPESPKIYTPELPESLCEIVRKCLKKKKKERYQSAKSLARDLKAVLEDPEAGLMESHEQDPVAVPSSDQPAMDDRTVRVGQQDDADGQTVRVGAHEDMDEATVRVGQDDGEATVQVGQQQQQRRRPGQVQTVSFKSASMVMNPNAPVAAYQGATDDDDDDPTKGLDLPQLDFDAGADEPSASSGKSKKKILIGAILVVVPLLLYAGLVAASRGRYGSLQSRFEQAKSSDDLDQLKAAAGDLDGFADSFSGQLSGYRAGAAAMASTLRELALAKESQQTLDEAEKRRREQELQDLQKKAAEIAEARRHGLEALQELAALEEAKDWRNFTTKLLEIEQAYRDVLEEQVRALKLPVFVTSYPDGAKVTLASNGSSVETPGVLWVRPHQKVELSFEKPGFKPETREDEANKFLAFDATLNRLVLRRVNLGQTQVHLGPRVKDEPLNPVHALQVDVSTGVAYYVGHDGYLHDVHLGDRPRPSWTPNPEEHLVGVYGDPTPSLTLVPGHVILISSLAGRVSAHTPSNAGQRVWDFAVAEPVTSPPGYQKSQGVLAVGTMSGEVIFLSERGRELWRFQTENRIVSAPFFLREDLAIVGSTDNRLYALDWTKSRMRSMVDLGSDVVAGPVPVGRRLLVATSDGALHAVEVDRAGVLAVIDRVLPEEGAVVGGLIADGSRAYFSLGTKLHGYSLNADGKLTPLWDAVRTQGQLSQAVVRGSRVYAGGLDGVLSAIDRDSGQVLWRHDAGAPVNDAPVSYGDELFLTAGNQLVVLKAD